MTDTAIRRWAIWSLALCLCGFLLALTYAIPRVLYLMAWLIAGMPS